ncbi:MAG: S41 family peptidase [Bacteroidales bacterium]
MKRKLKTTVLVLALLAAPLIFTAQHDREFEWSKQLDIHQSLLRELDLFYVDEVDPGKLIRSGIDQMLRTLDPYTVYIPESRIEDIQLMTTGEYGGVGALIGQKGDTAYVTDPYEGSPAQKAGLRAGDIIRKVNGRSVIGRKLSEISEEMKGEIGSAVSLTVLRPYTQESLTFNLVREKIRFPNVPHYQKVSDETGYIRIAGFTEGAGREVREALTDLKAQGINNIVLDFRGNPGGLLMEAVEMVNLFVPKGQEVVTTRGKARQWVARYSCRSNPLDTLIPVAVLVNSASASASEIVAGALQDLDRGVIIGQRTFGKGLVQATRDLSYKAKLNVTTAKYYIPSGRCIQALDYTNRRPDGSVGSVPDSLTTEFTTKAGRKVRDGGGIVPDIPMEVKTLGGLATGLVYQEQLFDYATRFRNQNESIGPAGDFHLPDAAWAGFAAFLKANGYTYQTASEGALKNLEKALKSEKYFQESANLVDQISRIVNGNLERDLELFKPEISTLLEEEIVSRYYFQSGRVRQMIRNDQDIAKAVEILSNQGEYDRILGR